MICLTSHTKTNPNRKFWKCPNWKDEKGCGRFIWKDEVDYEKNVAALMEDMKKIVEKLNENICVAVEEMRHATEERKEMRHATEERKKSNKFLSVVVFVSSLVIVICMMKNV